MSGLEGRKDVAVRSGGMEAIPRSSQLTASNIMSERGGFVDVSGNTVTWPISSLYEQKLFVTASAGHGLPYILCELIVHAITNGLVVRVLDIGGSFTKLCEALGGVLMKTWRRDVWNSPESNLVVFDLEIEFFDRELASNSIWQQILSEMHETPAEFWFLATEAWMYGHHMPRANCIASLGPIPATYDGIILCGQIKKERMPDISETGVKFLDQGGYRDKRVWVLADKGFEHHFFMATSPLRNSKFLTHKTDERDKLLSALSNNETQKENHG